MNDLIYYPTFEVANRNWLKFALLYVDKLHPIIPESGQDRLSNFTKRVTSETDLIAPYRPSSDEGWRATDDAIDHVDKILRNPLRFSSFFSQPNLIRTWTQPSSQD